jgi:hypothetical protein
VSPGRPPAIDGSYPAGDFFQIAFDRSERLHVAWTEVGYLLGQGNTNGVDTNILYAHQR